MLDAELQQLVTNLETQWNANPNLHGDVLKQLTEYLEHLQNRCYTTAKCLQQAINLISSLKLNREGGSLKEA